MEKYSVLMSVYHKEKAEYLQTAMESILGQTVPADDFVLVCDGPLNDALDAVIEKMQEKFGAVLQVVRLEKNGGLGNALNVGIQYCKNELVARMDSDDISYPDRCERQLQVFAHDPRIQICSGTIEEFTVMPDIVDSKRVLPETSEKIRAFAKKRTPFNHASVMYKKTAVESAGGYQDFFLLEDYYLWVRMLIQGVEGCNLQEPLLWVRAGSDMYKRRAGWKYAKSQMRLFWYMYRKKFINLWQLLSACFIRVCVTMAPNSLRRALYERKLRQ